MTGTATELLNAKMPPGSKMHTKKMTMHSPTTAMHHNMAGMNLHHNIAGMNMNGSGLNLLPEWAAVAWVVAYGAVVILHCWHLIETGGERRWIHGGHAFMCVGMICMYLSVPFGWTWFPPHAWMAAYACTTIAAIGWFGARVATRRLLDVLLLLSIVDQGAMIYMFSMFSSPLIPALSWILVTWFGLLTLGWLTGLLPGDAPSRSRLRYLVVRSGAVAAFADRARLVSTLGQPGPAILLSRSTADEAAESWVSEGGVTTALKADAPYAAASCVSGGAGSALAPAGLIAMAVMSAGMAYFLIAMQFAG